MVCRLFGVKLLTELIANLLNWTLRKKTSAKFEVNYKQFHSRTFIWKYPLQKCKLLIILFICMMYVSMLWRSCACHDDVIKWKHFPRYWPFLRRIHRSPVNSPHKGQWRGTLMFFYLNLNKQLSKQSRGWWFETQSGSLWRQCNVICTCIFVIILTRVFLESFNIFNDIWWLCLVPP